ncbi:MAG: SusC/RagA family TonB-linked outer membrane protein [Bacteroidales bacterium]|nr:SusC/RagA family TonB-linked outer membrane protein [Bacteroidales bacterium]
MSRTQYITACLTLILSAIIIAPSAGQDTIRINGTVQNEKGIPLQGVTLSLEGVFSDPEVSDSNGEFSLIAPSGYHWLKIKPLKEYKEKRVFLNGRTTVRILLSPSNLSTGDDLVLGVFNSELKRDFISSAQHLQPAKLHQNISRTIDESLSGNIAGAYSISQSGMPGIGVVNYIRGYKSMYTNSQPLIVIDGMPLESPGLFNPLLDGYSYNPLTTLDPNDITSINILKDYTAGSAYGLRGTNGVVVIETLKPTEVRTIIDFIARTGVSTSPNQIPQLDALEYRNLANEMLFTSGILEEELPGLYPGLYSEPGDPDYIRYSNNTNWQNEVFRNSISSDYYMRIMGGDQIARYGLSVGYMNHQGIIKNTDFSRLNVRFVGTFSLFKWLRFYVSSNLTRTDAQLEESARSEQTSPILSSLHKTPMMIPYEFDASGNQLLTFADVEELGVSSPSVIVNDMIAKNKNYRFLTSVRLEGDIAAHLKWNSLLGINLNAMDELIFMPNHGMELYYNQEAKNVSKTLKDYFNSIYNDNNISYNREFDKQHKVSATAGLRINTNLFEEDWGIAKNSNENDEYRSLQSGTLFLSEIGGQYRRWNRLAAYSNLNYTLRDRYLFHAGLMSETSSLIGRNAIQQSTGNDLIMIGDVPFGLFYAVGGAWRISSESFLQDYTWLEDLKLRMSWGSAGNDDIGYVNSLRYYQIKLYRESSGVVPGNISNRTNKFETGTQWNPGIDLALLANRISLSFDYYSARTRDLFVYEPQAFYTGFDYTANNNGLLSNRGWEISVFTRMLNSGSFTWDMGFNVSGLKNEIIEISNDEIITDFHGGSFISREGESLLNFYGLSYTGVYSTQAEAEIDGFKNSRGIAFGAGDARFEDLSKDGIIDQQDRTLIGSPIPDFFGSAYTKLSYGIWSLSGSIQFVSGNEVYNQLRSQNEKMSDLSNQSTNVLNRWQYDGHLTDIPRATWDDPIGNSAFSSRWIEDGSYLKLKYLTLSCHFPDNILVFRDAEIFITGMNLFTLTNYLGYDPEFAVSYNTMEQGIDYGLMPQTRKFMIGIKLGL